MLKKLSSNEKANLYRTVADLESNYGLERVKLAMKELCESLDGQHQPRHEQIELLPFEPEPERPPGKRAYNGRRKHGENARLIKQYFDLHKHEMPGVFAPDEMIVKLYYFVGDNQYKIADRIGVNQRAISDILRSVSEKKKRALISRWEEGKVNGY